MTRDRRARVRLAAGGLLVLLALGVHGCLTRHQNDSTPARSRCTRCHGSESRSGTDVQKAAPPFDLTGSTKTSWAPGDPPLSRGVGAHEIHLRDPRTHKLVACDQCHVVPQEWDDDAHGKFKRPAKLTFGDLASQGGRSPTYDPDQLTCTDTYCHRDAKPNWLEPRSSKDACGTCHGLPPPAPHPQQDQCSKCHADVVDANRRDHQARVARQRSHRPHDQLPFVPRQRRVQRAAHGSLGELRSRF